MEEKRIQGNSEWLAEFHLALEDKVYCEVSGCDSEAEWYMLHRCCKKVFLGCTDHCHTALRHLRIMAVEGRIVVCGWCSSAIAPMAYMTHPQPIRLQP